MRARSTAFHFLAATSSTLFFSGGAQAAKPEPVPAPSTGSPSNAASTVSPATVAQAVEQAGPTAPNEPAFDVSLGTTYSRGGFGASTRTDIVSTALAARLALGALRLNASVPYMRIRSSGTVFTGIDSTPIVVAARTGARKTFDGVGDLTLGGTYTLPAPSDGVELELSGRVKLPTASRSSGLSSRKVDYSAGVQATKGFGRIAPFVSASYRIFGDPRAIRLKDGFAASAGTSFVVDDRTILLASYHYAQKASRLIRDSHELFAGLSRGLGDSRFRVTGFATAGLSSGAAGVSGGLSLSMRL